jgi:DNA mismatch repair ATPase MutL
LVRELAAIVERDESADLLSDEVKKIMLDGLASESCHGSVRAGQSLSPVEAISLLQQMDVTDFAGHCPHGRPTTLRLDWREIEKMFKRIV